MSNIESVLHENRVFEPAQEFVEQANISGMAAYQALCQEAEEDYEGFWARQARDNLIWQSHSPTFSTRVTHRSSNGLTMAN